MPLALHVYLKAADDSLEIKRDIILCAGCAVSWAIGYGLFWAAKWVISSALLQQDIISQAISQITYRSGEVLNETEGGESITNTGALLRNLSFMFPTWTWKIAAVSAAALLVFRWFFRDFFKPIALGPIVILLAIAMPPYAWYFLIANHSWVHYWFTWRNQAITVFSVLLLASYVLRADPRKRFRAAEEGVA